MTLSFHRDRWDVKIIIIKNKKCNKLNPTVHTGKPTKISSNLANFTAPCAFLRTQLTYVPTRYEYL